MTIRQHLSRLWSNEPGVISDDGTSLSAALRHKFVNRPQEVAIDNLQTECQRKVPNLPDEIVQEIMLSATDTLPSPFSSHCRAPITSVTDTPFPFLYDSGSYMEIRLLKEAQKTKVALSEVSKLWRELSAEYLFNLVDLNYPWQIALLSRAFDADKARRGGTEGPGCWAYLVRRLWVNRNCARSLWIKPAGEFSMLTLDDVFRRCPNIIAFRHIGDFVYPSVQHLDEERGLVYGAILRGAAREENCSEECLTSYFGDPLELDLDVMGFSMQFLMGASMNLALVFRFIRVLKLRSFDSFNTSDKLLTAVEFSALEYLQLDSARWVPQVTLFRMPSLRRLSLNPGQIGSDGAKQKAFLEFLKFHGDRLEEMTLFDPLRWKIGLGTLCPNLVRLNAVVLSSEASPRIALGDINHTSITSIGLGGLDLDGEIDRTTFDLFFDSLFNAFPNVEAIQAMTWPLPEILSRANSCWSRGTSLKPRTTSWIGLLELVEARGIRLLDWRGLPIRVRGT